MEDDFDWNPADRDNGIWVLLFRVPCYGIGKEGSPVMEGYYSYLFVTFGNF